MTNTASKLKRAICSMVVMLALVAGITSIPVLAASNGIYTATATSHYKHPTTGKIEDSGGEGSYVLGQSMTDSALNKAALVEVDPQGNTFVTVRLNLMDNIQNPQFPGGRQLEREFFIGFRYSHAGGFHQQYHRLPDAGTQRKRHHPLQYVCDPHGTGRDLLHHGWNLQSGSGDFVTSITVQEPEPEPEQPAVTTPQTQTPSSQTSSEQTPSSSQAPSSAAPSSSEASSSNASSADSSSEDSSSEALGLEEFDASGNKVSDTSTEAEQDSSTGNPVIWWVIGGIVIVAIAGGCVWYFWLPSEGVRTPFRKSKGRCGQ